MNLLLIILVVFAGVIVVKGVETSAFSIDSYSAISEKNDELETAIKEANNQKEINYTKQKSSLESAYKLLQSERENYEQLLNLGVDKNGIPLSKIQEYEIEKIWITLGGYAEEKGVDLKIDITVNNSVSKTYDLNFTICGTYTGIEDYLRAIQGDKTLVFKIDDFKLVSGGSMSSTITSNNNNEESSSSDDILTATFVCKDIKLNIVDGTSSNPSESEDGSSQDTTTSSSSAPGSATSSTSTKSTTSTQNSNISASTKSTQN